MRDRSSKRVTIRHVALEAGVSTQTVSRVVNNIPGVLPDTREKVQKAIDRLGYRPNVIARSLSQRRSYSIGVVASGIDYYGPSRTLVGIEQGANEAGYSLNLSLLHQPESDDVQPLIDGFLSRQVDGIIWATQEIGDNLGWLEQEHFPIPVVFLETRPRREVSVVNVDSRYGSWLAVQHLISRGHKKIGVITGPSSWWSARERLQGWQAAMTAAGLEAEGCQIAEGNWTTSSGAVGLEKLLEQCPDMDAVFVSNDQMALGVLQTSRKLGRRVPEELAVVGYDDIPESAYFWPPLTTVRQDLMLFGRTAVSLLKDQITASHQEGDFSGKTDTIWLKPDLIVRGSSGGSDPSPESVFGAADTDLAAVDENRKTKPGQEAFTGAEAF
jgi:LacI family transcriptional regulator